MAMPSAGPSPSFSTLPTTHGILHITSTTPNSPHPSPTTILLLHGNSSSSQIFTPVFASPLSQSHPLLAFDLPGHGSSSDAPDTHTAYTQPGYASAALDVLQHAGVKDCIALGWSLGGHNGIELLNILTQRPELGIKMRGLMIVGTPPAQGKAQLQAGFKWGDRQPSAAAMVVLTPKQMAGMANATAGTAFGGKLEPWMLANVERTDGRARERTLEAGLAGEGCDQRGVCEGLGEGQCVLAVVNGAKDQFVNLDYVDAVRFGNLWEGRCHRIDGQGHTPFWEDWGKFWPLLERFVRDCA